MAKMDEKFSAMYEADIRGGRTSIAPEKLMRAMLLQVLFSIRSERQLVEQINYNLLFRWFVDLSIDDAVWNHSIFSKNRDRLIEHEAVTELFNATVDMADSNPLERLNAEIKRRTNVVGIFPNDAAVTRLVGAMLLEQNDEWSLNRRYMQLKGLQTLTDTAPTRLRAVQR